MSNAAFAFQGLVTPEPALPVRERRASARARNAVRIAVITDRAAFDALEPEWNELFERCAAPTQVFQSFNWCWHWANHFLASSPGGVSGVRLAVVTARREGKLVMVWPLVTERVRGVTQLFWMGEPVSQLNDVLIEDIDDKLEVMRAAWRKLLAGRHGDVLRLRHVRADAQIVPLLKEIGAAIVDRQFAPYMNLASAKTFEEFEQRYSGKVRKNRRRLMRRLEEKGTAEFVRLREGRDAGALAAQAVALKSEWLRDRGLVSTTVADARLSRLFSDFAEGKVHPVGCVVSALKSNEETAAVEVSFTCKGRLSMHMIAFNLAYEKSGAGVLLLENSLKDGYREGIGVYDMLAPADTYKMDWCDAADEICDWALPLSVKGLLYARLYLGLVRGHLKAALKKLPQDLRRRAGSASSPRSA